MNIRRTIGTVLLIAGVFVITIQLLASARTTSSQASATDPAIVVLTTDFQISFEYLIAGLGLAGLGLFFVLRSRKKGQPIT